MVDEYTDKKIVSPLDFAAMISLDDPSRDEIGELGEMESIHLITDSNFSPGFDIMLRFKSLDGLFNNLRLSFRVRNCDNAPGIVKSRRMLIGYSAQRDEVQEVNHILLSFSRPHALSGFLADLSAHVSSLSKIVGSDPGFKPEK